MPHRVEPSLPAVGNNVSSYQEPEAAALFPVSPLPHNSLPGDRASAISEWFSSQWSGEGWDLAALIRLVITFVILTVCSWLGIILSRQSEGVATIWLTNGLLFGLVITQPRKRWIAYFAVGFLADVLADVFYGDSLPIAIGVSLANSVEVVTSCVLLTRWFGSPFNLSKRRPLVGFLLVSVVGAAALTSALGASWTLFLSPGGTWWGMFRTWYLGDMLGMALIAPLVFMLQRPGFFSIMQPKHVGHTTLLLLVPAIATILVFTHSEDSLTFLIFPALLLIVIRLGFPGTVISIFVVALLSIAFTIRGHGPLMLIPGEHAMLHRIVVAQIFLAVAIFTMFPVAALLEERAALQQSLEESEVRYRKLANIDELTGLFNRRAFNLRLEHEWQQGLLTGQSIALLILDVDLFKKYNDVFGHLKGDECLRSLAGIVAASVGESIGVTARIGGEEFAVILPATAADAAEQLAEKIREDVFKRQVPHPCTVSGIQTVSIGVSTLVPGRGQDMVDLIALADKALYRAKDLGRNQVAVAEPLLSIKY